MNDGFVRCGSAVPDIKVADCAFNAEKIIEKVREAAENGCSVLVFPELCITGYTCGDLFLSETLKNGAAAALKTILAATAELDILFIVGLPVPYLNRLYNCAFADELGVLAPANGKTDGHSTFLSCFINIIPFLIIKYNENNPKIATTALSTPLIIAISFFRVNYQNQI